MELKLLQQHQIPELAQRVADDPEIMKWLAIYSYPNTWTRLTPERHNTLTIEDEQETIGFTDIIYNTSTATAIIDYCLFQPHRGKGKTEQFFQQLHEWITIHTNVRNLSAYVDQTNIPSVKALEKAGYMNHGVVVWGLNLYTYRVT